MKKLGKVVFFLLFIIISGHGLSQPQITVPDYTSCPNQPVTVTATWNNVFNITYTLVPPGGGTPVQVNGNTFTISSNVNGTSSYQLLGNGSTSSGTISSSVFFNLTIVPPAPMTMTVSDNGVFCHGENAIVTAPIGGSSYTVLGGCFNNFVSSSNIITLPNVNQNCNANYTVVTDMSGCLMTGTMVLNVSANFQIAISNPSTVCEGEQVIFNAALNGGTNWVWKDNSNNVIPGQSGSTYAFAPTINQAGTITVEADFIFAGKSCHRKASTSVAVVQTVQVVASVVPGNNVCQGTNVNLQASAGNNATYQWAGPNSFFSTSANPVVSNINPQQQGQYSVTALFVGSGKTCSTNAQINISVIPVSAVNITMTPEVCEGEPGAISMTASAIGAKSYSWNGPAFGGSPQGGSAVTFSGAAQPNHSGTYYVTAYFGPSNQCVVTNSSAITVVAMSQVVVTPTVEVCAPTNANLQANATGASLFHWEGPNNFTTPGANVVVYYTNAAAAGIYTVTANFNGANITCKNSNTVELIVNPTLNFSLVPRQMMCFNEPVKIEGPAGATSYTWTSSTGIKSNDKDLIFGAIQPKDAGSYTLHVSLGPCITAGETVIEVVSPITFTLRPSDKTICRGDTIVVEGGVTGGSQNYAYTWNPPMYMNSPTGPKKVINPEGTVLYNLMVYDIACPSFSLAHSFSINVNQPPVPTLTLPTTTGCAPFNLKLSTNTQTAAAITTFDFGGKLQFQTYQDTVDYTLNDPGTYTLKIYSKGKNGCSGTFEFPYPLVVHPRPGTEIRTDPEFPTTVDEVTFKPVHTTDDFISRYTWQFSGGVDVKDTSEFKIKAPGADTTNMMSPVRMYDKVGRYPVMLISTTDKGCSDTAVKFLKVIDDLKVFVPNAFTPNGDGINDLFMVKGIGIELENFTLEVTDRWGTVVFFTRDINTGWDGTSKGSVVRDGIYSYNLKVVGMNGEGRKEYNGHVVIIK